MTLGEGDERITLQWKGGLPKPTLKGARAEYADAVPGADVVVEATRTGFEQYVEIKERPTTADYTYTLPLKAEGLKAKQLEDGSVLFTDRKNRKRAVMPAPVMWDSTVDERSGEHLNRARVDMRVVQTKDGVDLVVSPDREFLADPDTRYPVTVDLSTLTRSSVFDTYVQQGETVDWSGDVELDFGNPGTKNADGTPRTAQSFITWNTTPIQDALVSSARLSLWNFHSGNTDCKLHPWEVWASGAASTSSRWTNRPAMTAKKATSTETRGNAGWHHPARRLDQRRRHHPRPGVGVGQGHPWPHGPARLGRVGRRPVEAGQLRQRGDQPAEAGGELQLPSQDGHPAGGRSAVLLLRRRLPGEHHHTHPAGHVRRRRR
ncbi:hypothetical protein SGLAM104S_09355 [Streptomyces glaucescens]